MATVVGLNDDAWEDVENDAEALLDEWLVKEGDSVTTGQCMANVMLIKASHEILSPVDGIVSKLLVEAEENFPKGQALCEIE